MRRPTRPAHRKLNPAEILFDERAEQRSRENGFLLALLLALSPTLVPLAIYALSAWGWL